MKKKELLKQLAFSAAVCLAGLTTSALNVSAGNDDNIEARLFKKVENAVANGRVLEVKADIQRILKLNPKNAGAMFFAGLYSYENGSFANAEKFFKRLENHDKYGAKAREYMAEIGYKRYRESFKGTLDVLLSGESYDAALSLCEEALRDIPDNPEVLFSAAYSAAMLTMPDKAARYADLYQKAAKDKALGAELQTFISAWFAESYEEEAALEKLMNITSRRLITDAVKNRIKELIFRLHKPERFEAFIERERLAPGADMGALDRELADFYISEKQFDKALKIINRRPVEELEDNIIFIKLLTLSGEELRAMSAARSLMEVNKDDLRIYRLWTDAWLQLYKKKENVVPTGKDSNGRDLLETADMILESVKPEMLAGTEPELLMNMLRISIIIDNKAVRSRVAEFAGGIEFNEERTKTLIECVDELVVCQAVNIAVNLLESASNQQPDNHSLIIKLAEIQMVNNPQTTIKLLEGVLAEKPHVLPAFLLWVDAMSFMGRGGEAEEALVARLEEPGLEDLVRRRLASRLEMLRIGTTSDQYETEDEYDPANSMKIIEMKNTLEDDSGTASGSETESDLEIEQDGGSEADSEDPIDSGQ